MKQIQSYVFNAGISLLAAGLGPSCVNSVEKQNEGQNPNIIYILADDLGYGDLGCYGQQIIETPNIDKMASEGILFTRHYSGSTVCAPSRSSLLTGQHTGHTPIRGNKPHFPEGQHALPEDAVTVAEMLKDAGYITGAYGKWGLGFVGTEGDPNKQGFDEFFGFNCQRYAHRYYPTYLWHNNKKVPQEGNDWDNTKTYAPDVIHEKAIEFINDHQDTSFFLFLPYVIPHAEIVAPRDSFYLKYKGKFEERPFIGNDYGADDFKIPGYCSQNEPRTVFAAMVSRLDHQVGEIINLLHENKIAENTLVIFTSDNGPHLEGGADPGFFDSNGGLRGHKRDLYEGGIRVPMIAWWPGTIEARQTTGHISAFWDIQPTFADIVHQDVPENTDGISFLPTLLKTGEQTKHDFLYWEFLEQGGKQAVLMDNWKAIRQNMDKDPNAPIELYDLSKDPSENINIANEYPEITKKMIKYMQESHEYNPVFHFAFE